MTKGKIMDGVFAINKPKMISSAQVVRDLQHKFQPSELFAPWLANAKKDRQHRENHNQRQRRKSKEIKVKIGHGGTLDPLATGVLIMGVGTGTKSLSDFLLCTKVYEAVVLFGTSTDSYDRVGRVLAKAPYEHITEVMVEEALEQFRGKSLQLPPLFSALKMDGKPLYEYAREGKVPPREIARRQVEVLELEMVEWMEGGTHSHEAPSENATPAEINVAKKLWKQEDAEPGVPAAKNSTPSEESESKKRKISEDADDLVKEWPTSKRKIEEPEDATIPEGLSSSEHAEAVKTETVPVVKGPPAARLRMTVTSGFYVRSLCHDLGTAVGSAALMAELERIRQGDFEVGKNALEYEDLAKGEDVWGPKISGFLDDWYETETKPRGLFKKRSASPGQNKEPAEEYQKPAHKAQTEASGSGVKEELKVEDLKQEVEEEDIKSEAKEGDIKPETA
ncbi:pseudouridine synthase [Calycina marina]|uniref:tRNA pseudouridine(55) synthase n=1 Tax=Calycina marina TaxID=1763456 RepID=A0A9P7Z589_9HELO|nr:pseudouridine synthase [Calycina marina]